MTGVRLIGRLLTGKVQVRTIMHSYLAEQLYNACIL